MVISLIWWCWRHGDSDGDYDNRWWWWLLWQFCCNCNCYRCCCCVDLSLFVRENFSWRALQSDLQRKSDAPDTWRRRQHFLDGRFSGEIKHTFFYFFPTSTSQNRKREWLLAFQNKTQTHERVKENAIYYDKTQDMSFRGMPLFSRCKTSKEQLYGEKWDVGHLSAFGSVVLLDCFGVQWQ